MSKPKRLKPVTVDEIEKAVMHALVSFDPRPLDLHTAERALALVNFEIKWAALRTQAESLKKHVKEQSK